MEAILIVGTLHQSFTDSVFEFAEVALRKKTLIQCFDKIGVEQSDDIERRKDIESYRFNLKMWPNAPRGNGFFFYFVQCKKLGGSPPRSRCVSSHTTLLPMGHKRKNKKKHC